MRALGVEIDVVCSVEGRPMVTAQDIHNMVARARHHLGLEIWEQTGGRVTGFCHGIGTGSSLIGVSHALRDHGVFVQGHEPASSAAISGGASGPFLIQGWTGFVVSHWDPERVDHVEPIGDDEALETTARLSREDGIFAGISTGANVVGAHRLAERLGSDAVIVTLAVDSAFKYMSVSPFADL
jgi:cysteine synthase